MNSFVATYHPKESNDPIKYNVTVTFKISIGSFFTNNVPISVNREVMVMLIVVS